MIREKGKPVRPFRVASIRDKRFKPYLSAKARRKLQLAPALVASDLQAGTLKSLGDWLAANGSVGDSAVAAELRKLIDGSHFETPFRLVITDHPDCPQRGGRPARERATSVKYRGMIESYAAMIAAGDKRYVAIERLSTIFRVSCRTVRRVLAECSEMRDAQILERARMRVLVMRERALVSLRSPEPP